MHISIVYLCICLLLMCLLFMTFYYLIRSFGRDSDLDHSSALEQGVDENVISLFGSYPPAYQVQPENRELIYHRFVQDFMDVENARDLTAEQYMEQQMRLKRAGRMLLSQMKLE